MDEDTLIISLRLRAEAVYNALGHLGVSKESIIENQAADLISSQAEEIKRLREALADFEACFGRE